MSGTGVVKDPSTLRNFLHGNRETSVTSEEQTGTGRCKSKAVRERGGGVGPAHSTQEGGERKESLEGRGRAKENTGCPPQDRRRASQLC